MLQQTNVEVLSQLSDLLIKLDENQYKQPLKTLHQHAISQHVRHIIEFYKCLLKGYVVGEVNYDERERKLRIEQDKDFALQVMATIIGKLTLWEADKPLQLISHYGTNDRLATPTYFSRELVYLIEHTIHHLAIIKIAINEAFPSVDIPENFGVAYSTLAYKASK